MLSLRLRCALTWPSLSSVPCLAHRFIRHFGVRFALRSSLLTCAIVYACTVPLTLIADAIHPAVGTAVCVLLVSIGNAASGTASTASFAATNNAASKFPGRVGTISGVHVTAEAVGKMLGPAVGAPLLGALLTAFRPGGASPPGTLAPSTAAGTLDSSGSRSSASSALAVVDSGPGPAAAAIMMMNGASATMAVFSLLSFSVFLAALALPRVVDGPRRTTLLQGQVRSDVEVST